MFESKYIYITSRPIFKGDVVRRLFMHVCMYACMYVCTEIVMRFNEWADKCPSWTFLNVGLSGIQLTIFIIPI